jgi:branched-chain amino acid aminotransferase
MILRGMQIQMTPSPKKKPATDSSLIFGKVFSDHMLEVDWEQANGFGDPRITPYRKTSLYSFALVASNLASCEAKKNH